MEKDLKAVNNPTLIDMAIAGDKYLKSFVGGKGELGSGGMLTKLHAAEVAAHCGAFTVIVGGHEQNVLVRVLNGEKLGTFLYPSKNFTELKD